MWVMWLVAEWKLCHKRNHVTGSRWELWMWGEFLGVTGAGEVVTFGRRGLKWCDVIHLLCLYQIYSINSSTYYKFYHKDIFTKSASNYHQNTGVPLLLFSFSLVSLTAANQLFNLSYMLAVSTVTLSQPMRGRNSRQTCCHSVWGKVC